MKNYQFKADHSLSYEELFYRVCSDLKIDVKESSLSDDEFLYDVTQS